jgi:chaperonin GroES
MRILHDRVLLKIEQPEEKTSGGIFLAPASTESKFEGVVIEAGPGKTTKDGVLVPLTVKAGDKVMYNPKSGSQVKMNGEVFLVTTEDEIYCILEG